MLRPTLPVRLALAVAAGLALWLAFPDHDLWWLAPVGVALLAAATLSATVGHAFLVGLVGGLAFFVPVLSWSGTYVGALPWLALATLQALYVAAMCAVVGYAGRRLLDAGRRTAALACVPLGWVAQELARGTTPWGGFPWARLAFSQADSPLAHVAAWLGAPGVTAAVATAGAGLLGLATALRPVAPRRLAGGAAAATLPLLAGAVPVATDGRAVEVGMVQGNVPRAGLEFNAERRAVLDNHVRGTEALAARAPDDLSLVVWPENASDIDPLRNLDAAAQVQRAVDAVGVPVLVGAVLAEPPGRDSNVSLLYRPGRGEPERYTKLHPAPFAEWIPFRSFFRNFSGAVDLAGDFVAGTEVGSFRIEAEGGAYWALPTICFEVAYDGLVRDAVREHPGDDALLVVQTNNATFGRTAESEQQFAISRIRAIEHGRSVAHVSTVGVSGLVLPDGSVVGKTGLFTVEQVLARPVLRSGTTPADRLGRAPELLAVVALAALTVLAQRSRRPARVGEPAARRTTEDAPVG
ncbi:MAG TPA: apolipoprotein N-acyltransferase [Dermatophilaceae bacterium]|nr:apolipoprotein N-acyltransferase [Dermatophilaceae bacterium]